MPKNNISKRVPEKRTHAYILYFSTTKWGKNLYVLFACTACLVLCCYFLRCFIDLFSLRLLQLHQYCAYCIMFNMFHIMCRLLKVRFPIFSFLGLLCRIFDIFLLRSALQISKSVLLYNSLRTFKREKFEQFQVPKAMVLIQYLIANV